MKNFKELKRTMQASGGYGIPQYATALNMHKVSDNLRKSSAEHCPPGQRYDPAHDRCNLPVHESRYGDAMTSRLPSHLDDPRTEEKKVKKHPYVTSGKFDYKKFSKDREKRPEKFIAGLEESRYKESGVPHHGHPYHKESDADLHYIMKDAKEAAADAKTRQDHEVAAEYEEQHKKAGHILAYRQGGGKQVKEDYRYQDAMMSRLPAHLDDPRVDAEKKVVKKAVKRNPRDHAWKLFVKQPVKESVWESYRDQALLEESEIAFNESGPPKHPYPPVDIHHRGIYVATTTWAKNQKHARAQWLSLHPDHKEADVKTSYGKTSLKESEETYKVGDHVVPKIGPHKGQVHRVIHVHPTGHLNIKPEGRGKNHYRLGATKADPKDLEDAPGHGSKKLEEHLTPKHYTLGPLTLSTPKKKLAVNDKHGWIKNRGNQFVKGPVGVKINNLWNRKTVQEVFQAAKDKKSDNPFTKKDADKDTKPQKELVDNLPTDGAHEPNKDLSAAPPQFGKKEGNEGEKKQSNAPKAEKKTGKIAVQGPGPDDKFQDSPIVTTLTNLPDTASPKSGSQGVR